MDCTRRGRPYGGQMRRREFMTILGSAAAWPVTARAQLPIRRIGHLAIAAPTDTPPPPPANWHAFVQGLREIGYMEGQNIAFEHRSAHEGWVADDLPLPGARGCGRSHLLRTGPSGYVSPLWRLRWSHIGRHQACRPPHCAPSQVRVGREPQDRESPRNDYPRSN